jgi:hemoglobin
MADAAELSLYDAIGGEAALVAVVEDFYLRVSVDPQLSGFFAGVNMVKLKTRAVEFLTTALGGPGVYRGKSMRKVHAGRHISQADFDKIAFHLTLALAAAGVPAGTVVRITDAITPLADDIVSREPS